MSPLSPPSPTHRVPRLSRHPRLPRLPRHPRLPRLPLAAAALILAVCLTATPACCAPAPHAVGLAVPLLSHPPWQLLLQLWAGPRRGTFDSGGAGARRHAPPPRTRPGSRPGLAGPGAGGGPAGSTCPGSGTGLPGDTYGGCDPNG